MRWPVGMSARRPRSHRRAPLPRIGLATAFVAALVCVVSIAFLAATVRRDIDALATANADAGLWSLAQTEVDLMALHLAAVAATERGAGDMAAVRRRFDIFYSRVRILADSRQFLRIRADPEAAAELARLTGFLDTWTPVFDTGLDALRDALPALAPELAGLRDPARAISSRGVQLFAAQADARRDDVTGLLNTVALLTMGLVLTLSLVVAALLLAIRRSMRAERAAAETGNRLQDMIATSIDAILAVDPDGRILDYNGAAETIFGYPRAEALGRDLSTLIAPDPLRLVRTEDSGPDGASQRSAASLVRCEARRQDGTLVPVDLSISAVEEDGQRRYVSFVRDVSAQVAARRALIDARDRAVAGEQAKAELLAVMSHEMRTPLNGLLGTMELLEDEPAEPARRRYLSAMRTSAQLLLHHVNDVLTVSRAEAGQLDLAPTAVAPADLLAELVESQRQAIARNGNRVSLATEAAPARIWADRTRLNQVILNLVGNANKFTRDGEISVECEELPDGDTVEFRVIDTGRGIAEDDLERIFEDFRTLDTSYGRAVEGTGLGLAISRRLVRSMGGEIGVESEPGEGSLFWVRLPVGVLPAGPVQPNAADTSPVAPDPAEPARPMSVLLVEDNEINRLVAREMLARAGHRVVEAPDGREGIAQADRQVFDVILMDIAMPVVDGVAATRAIRGGDGPNRETPIVALTAHALPDDLARFEAAGVTRTLVKPLTQSALRRALSSRPVDADMSPDTSTVIGELAQQLGAQRAGALLDRFIEETEALVVRLKTPHAETATALAAETHRCAGAAAVFRCGDLVVRLRALETALRTGDAGRDIGAFRDSWPHCRDRLTALRRTLGDGA